MNTEEYLKQLDDFYDVRDAQIILAHVIGRPRTWLLAHLDTPLTPLELDAAKEAFEQLQSGTPLPYIIGHWEFFGLDFEITKDVLIPRPETELLVEKAIAWLQKSKERSAVADIGTGSGAIGITLAKHIPNIHILATDISSAALQIAKRNANKFNVEKQIQFIECDLLPDSDPQPLDLICANLPYISTQTLHGLPVYGREPTLALDGGTDGLDIYRRLFKLAPEWLAPKSMMLLEIESSQATQACDLAHQSFLDAMIQVHQDLTGRDRLLEIVSP
jgi:release factor glutamine methyltransferase